MGVEDGDDREGGMREGLRREEEGKTADRL